ncbi:hypothetical protein MTR67_047136 [Solanum verrucosum]|uniref:Disease resistance R13L4/SHOC-2-like LRR domain-containing protein n=1 Tax=Solanum verrucosum TaxID=315347 RepID=A0AAF0UYR8_SOLVR|nr:hypothetical protein MTR67_047136 [Solanum verrucosum]
MLLSGPIPEEIGYLRFLTDVRLYDNSLNGSIPAALGNLTNLLHLYLYDNHLSGPIPEEIGYLRFLTDLQLYNNSLNGSIHASLGNLNNLSVLYLDDLGRNNLKGAISTMFWQYEWSSEVLDMQHNNLSGTLPMTFRAGTFRSFNMHGNKLKGKIPQSLANCKEMQVLDLGDNRLNDRFPMWLGTLPELRVLSLRSNKLHGPLRTLGSKNMFLELQFGSLNLSHNMLTSVDLSPFQSLETIDLRSNSLQGSLPIPPNSTRFFFISENNLHGEIPSSICNLTSLVILDLARNNLKGAILQCLGNISSLRVLDMYHNSLTGTLPTTFRFGSSLRSLNLHGNKLEGKIVGNKPATEIIFAVIKAIKAEHNNTVNQQE